MKLLLTGAFNYTEEQLNILKGCGFEIAFVQNELEKLSIDCSQFDAVVCNNLFKFNPAENFTSLKAVQLISAGFNNAPVGYLASKGIALYNARGVYSAPIAEWVILKILEIYKHSADFALQQKNKEWKKIRNLLELVDKRVLIVGTGSVGLECAKRLKAFDAQVIGADIYDSSSPFIDEFYPTEALTEVLPTADVVILTLPLNDKTRGLFSSSLLSLMKDDSILINVARGAIIDENALIQHLEKGKFKGVVLDVFEEEPLCESSPLWTCDRVSVTPHNSFVSDGNSNRMFSLILKNLTEFDFGKATR
ncbi:MAG: hypothetical protein E7566_07125 [Ruminococcaceae bacterium]|nr:hypothetical protein [Oscillospiraceae bacterium]